MAEEKRISAIIGAGINLDFHLQNLPSTSYITEKVVNASYLVVNYPDINNKENCTLVKDIYYTICQRYATRPLDPNKSYGIVHFEILYHVLEELYSYDKYWRVNRYHSPKEIPPFAYLTHCDIKYSSNHIRQVMEQFVKVIMSIVNEYDCEYAQNKDGIEMWYKKFWERSPLKMDVFTFNYDTTIEKSLSEYEDGFEALDNYQFKQMNPFTLLNSPKHTINHLHGSIMYGEDGFTLEDKNNRNIYDYSTDDWYCWNDFDLAQQHRFNSSDQRNQAGETIFKSPIITGLHKTDKIVNLPFDIYRYNLNRRLMTNNAILIAGYSFGDLYVNYELERMQLYHGDNWRVVLIDWWGKTSYESREDEVLALDNYLADLPYKNHQLFEFLCKVMEEGDINHYKYSRRWKYSQPNVSDNGRLMLFIGGTKEAFKHMKEIYGFLQS